MENHNNLLPDDMTIVEASAFWDEHSFADYESRLVELIYQPDGQTQLAISTTLLPKLQKYAAETGVSMETLVNLWIQEKLTAHTV